MSQAKSVQKKMATHISSGKSQNADVNAQREEHHLEIGEETTSKTAMDNGNHASGCEIAKEDRNMGDKRSDHLGEIPDIRNKSVSTDNIATGILERSSKNPANTNKDIWQPHSTSNRTIHTPIAPEIAPMPIEEELAVKERQVIARAHHTKNDLERYEQTFTQNVKNVKIYKGDFL